LFYFCTHHTTIPAQYVTSAARTTASSNPPLSNSFISSRRHLHQYPYIRSLDDLYSGGVTPGLVNIDQNPVTGTHLDAAGVSVDVSADKNYIGFAAGNIFGVGIARDRGFNVQIGGGNILDASVTKDAGIGLWILDGLININIMPDGTWSFGTVAARGTINEAVAAAVEPTPLISVLVDGLTATTTSSSSSSSSNMKSAAYAGAINTQLNAVDGWYHDQAAVQYDQLPASDLQATSSPMTTPLTASLRKGDMTDTSETSGVSYTEYDSSWYTDAVNAAPQQNSRTTSGTRSSIMSSAATAARPFAQAYIMPRPAVASDASFDSIPTMDDTSWSMAASYSDTAAMSKQHAAANSGSGSSSSSVNYGNNLNGIAQPGRRPCQGGVVVSVSGSKYKCKYRRTGLVRLGQTV
jgi:hypothetical protein